mgnify:CR=1 FL=1
MNECSKYYNTFVITGGEPGFLPAHYYGYLYNLNNLRININTNGFWLNRYNNYVNCTNLIVYHVFDEICGDEDLNLILRKEHNIHYAFLLHHQNIRFLEKLILNNMELFKCNEDKLIFYLYDNKQAFSDNFYNLTEDDLVNVYDILNKYIPSNKYVIALNKLINYKDLRKIARKLCNKYCLFPSVDLVNNTIKNCPNSYTNVPGTELNEINLRYLSKNELTYFENKNPLCDTCFNFIYKIDFILNLYLKGYR